MKEEQVIGTLVARFIKSTFDERVEEISSILPSGTPVPEGWALVKEDTYGVWAAKPEMLKAPFRGEPKWYLAVWALLTFDPIRWGELFFNYLTVEDAVEDALSCPDIPDVLRQEVR